MDAHEAQTPPPARAGRARFERLEPAGAAAGATEIVQALGLWERPDGATTTPRVLLNMVSTADGRASIGGRSGPISASADRDLFHALRSAVDAVLVGAETVRAERYGRIVPDASRRALRRSRGLTEEPLACVVSERLALDGALPLLAEPRAHVAVLTASPASLPAVAARVDYVRAAQDGRLDLAAALAQLRERFAVRVALCEGGPHLACQLLAGGLVDELFLTISPQLAGGEPAGGRALRILAGEELRPPRALQLRGALRSGHTLFLRYGVLAS